MLGYNDFELLLDIAKATTRGENQNKTRKTLNNSNTSGLMDKFFNSAKKKLVGGSSNSLSASKELLSTDLQHSNSTRTRQTTVSSLQLESGKMDTFERPESDEEIYELYSKAMLKLGVDVEKVPSLKNKSVNEMWQMVCTAGLQERDDRNTPEFFANTLGNDSKNSHLNTNFLKSLRIELGSKPLSWNDDFARFGGWEAVLEGFKKLKAEKKLEVKLPALREMMKIYRAFTNNKMGLEFVFGDPKRALTSLSVLIDVLPVPCMQCRLGALETTLMATLIDESRLVPVVIEAFRAENRFPNFTGLLTETFNAIRSTKDHDFYTFLLDSVLLINSLISYGFENKDLEFRMKLRSEIFNGHLKKAFNRYKVIDDARLTGHCESYLGKAQADAAEFMAQFDKNEKDLKTPLSLMQTVVEVLEDDSMAQDALLGLLTKMLMVSSKTPEKIKYIVAVDSLFDEMLTLSGGYAVDLDNLTFKGKEEKALLLTLKKSKEKLENDLAHANKRVENLSKLQTELESHIDAKGQRIMALAQEKKAVQDEFEALRRADEEEIARLKEELKAKDSEMSKMRDNGGVLEMSNLSLDSPTTNESVFIPPPPPPLPVQFGINAPPPPPPMPGINPNTNSINTPPAPPPMPGVNGFAPPPPPMPFSNGAIPPPPPMMGGPPAMFVPGAPVVAAVPQRIRPKPAGKTRQLQWEKLPQVKGTIWESLNDAKWESEIDYTGLENAFKYDPKISKQAFPQERRISFTTTGSALMDPKKARNMQIILGRLKLSPQELRTSLLRMDAAIWTDSIVHEIIKYLPNQSELEYIARFYDDPDNSTDGLKATAERMALEMSKVKGLEDRLCSIELKEMIGYWHVEAGEQLDLLLNGIDELKKKNSLKSFLELVLATGNFLNSGTYKANANGFKIDSLLKIRDMKTTEGSSNLLMYLLDFLHRTKSELLNLPVDIRNTTNSGKISLDGMTEMLAEKKRTISRLGKLVYNYKTGNFEDHNGGFDRYLSVIEPFLAEAEIHIEVVEEKLKRAHQEFAEILKYFGDDGNFKSPQDFFTVFSDFSADFERIKHELLSAVADETDLKKKISCVLKSQDEEGRNLIDNILGAARTT